MSETVYVKRGIDGVIEEEKAQDELGLYIQKTA